MIRITRRELHHIRRVFGKALGIDRRNRQEIVFWPCADGYVVGTTRDDVSVAYTLPHDEPNKSAVLPWRAVCELAGRNNTVVDIVTEGKTTAVTYDDNGRRQCAQYRNCSCAEEIALPPGANEEYENPGELLDALCACSEVVDRVNMRYALNYIQLHPGRGEVIATDGRHALLQHGFDLPGDAPFLIPTSGIWSYPELRSEKKVHVSLADNRLVIDAGPWTIALKLQEGRYPDVPRIIPEEQVTDTMLMIDEEDATAMRRFVALLPPKRKCPVTIALDGDVMLRALDAHGNVQEYHARRSYYSGPDISIAAQKKHLDLALKFGLREIHIENANRAVLCLNDSRRYAWMPLDNHQRVAPDRTSRTNKENAEPVNV